MHTPVKFARYRFVNNIPFLDFINDILKVIISFHLCLAYFNISTDIMCMYFYGSDLIIFLERKIRKSCLFGHNCYLSLTRDDLNKWIYSFRYCRYLFWMMKVSIIVYLIIFGLLPIIFHYSYTIQKKILFLNFRK